MISDIEILQAISASADMGCSSLKQALEKAKDKALKEELRTEITEYKNDFNQAKSLLKALDGEAKEAPAFAKFNSKVQVGIKTMMAEDTTSKIAEMVIEGSTMGVTKITKLLNKYTTPNGKVKALAEKHLLTQTNNIKQMKKFL